MANLSYLQIRNPKDDESSIEAATQIFSSLMTSDYAGFFSQLFTRPPCFSFELFLLNQTIYFYATVPRETDAFLMSLVASSYPKSAVTKTTDPVDILLKAKKALIGEVALAAPYYYPIKTYVEFADVDPLSPIIGYMAKVNPNVKMGIQILLTHTTFPWQQNAINLTKPKPPKKTATGETIPAPPGPNAALIARKIGFMGAKALIRLVVATNNDTLDLNPYLTNLAGTFGGFSLGEGNRFGFARAGWNKEKLFRRFKHRETSYWERSNQVLNAQELATIWHLPGRSLAGIKNIAWGKTLAGEPPENLPIADGLSEEQQRDINFFARTEFKNKETIFGLKTLDRRRHVYIIGKTGAGKSTLIANMAIDDIRKGRGVGIVDPHGDLCDTILDYIPKKRINDVIYLEPFDTERPFALNVLETKNMQNKHLISSGIVGIFAKLYADSWGPRLEYILRNVILTLVEIPGSTLVDILALLANEKYRKKIVAQIQDPVIKAFWEKEFEKMPDKMKAEAISPIQNKVGQFVSARMIRNIIGHPKSTIDLEEIMNNGKILILNLSQGKLGEDNASLLGAMIITQIQLAAMQRAFMPEEDRRDFMLYVDEFQNFATSSFIKILSEARKYRLCLNLTNQYIDQLDETMRSAIFGNVGTLISFVVGASDAEIFSKEYGGLYTPADLVALGRHEVVMKISIDNMMSAPFPAKTLPLPALKNGNREKIIKFSKERYGRSMVAEDIATPLPDTVLKPSETGQTTQSPAVSPVPQDSACYTTLDLIRARDQTPDKPPIQGAASENREPSVSVPPDAPPVNTDQGAPPPASPDAPKKKKKRKKEKNSSIRTTHRLTHSTQKTPNTTHP
ncbi:MAG: type IV secretion system DNA-binding domain-containing protein [Patescibacteria group bacterium]|nr:type IV secretion system DNA-binding domain-containing protein [Patescibacteria group bacterium]